VHTKFGILECPHCPELPEKTEKSSSGPTIERRLADDEGEKEEMRMLTRKMFAPQDDNETIVP
jgi:hypothetical protein